jgi:hypothetical protein
MKFYHRRLAACVVLTGLAVSVLVVSVHKAGKKKAEQSISYGRFTWKEIAARSEALCRLVIPAIGSLTYSPERMALPLPGRSAEKYWSVTVRNDAGQEVAHITWDAHTGALWYYSRPDILPPGSQPKPMSRRAAVENAWQWMRTTGIAAPHSRWRLINETCRDGDIWMVFWQGENRKAEIYIGAQNGELMIARSWGQPPPSPLPSAL